MKRKVNKLQSVQALRALAGIIVMLTAQTAWAQNYEIDLKSEYTSIPTVYAGTTNDMTVKVTNKSGADAQKVGVTLLMGEEVIGFEEIASLDAGATETLNFIDPTIRPITVNTINGNDNENVVYTVNVEVNSVVQSTTDFSFVILYNGNLGKDYEYTTDDSELRDFSFTGDVQVLTQDEETYMDARNNSRNDIFKVVLGGGTVNKALLYVAYNWQNPSLGDYTTWTTTFNDKTVNPLAHYCDQGNLGNYGGYKYGMVVYDVTNLVVDGDNTFYLEKIDRSVSVYPSSLIVMTDNPSSSPKVVYILEEADLLSKSNNKNKDAIYESSFEDIPEGDATLYVFAAGGQAGEGDMEINGVTNTNVFVDGYSTSLNTITASVDPGDVSVKLISTGSTILALHQMIVVDLPVTGDANGDKKVNVADIVRLVKDKAPKADIDAVVKIIMGR